MKRKAFNLFLKTLSRITHKNIIDIPYTRKSRGLTAVKSLYGFWYCGDVFEQSDIAYGILANGDVESSDTRVVLSVLKHIPKDFVFYDIGSNTGWYSLVAATVGNAGYVYSFEPLEEHVLCERESVTLNRKDDYVSVFEIALSDASGKSIIRLAGSGTSLEHDFLEADFGKREVQVEKLDIFKKKEALKNPDFIKIDVEGHEYQVLLGAKKTLEESHPALFIEIAKTIKKRRFINKNFTLIFSFLASLGYEAYIAEPRGVRKYNPEENPDNVYMYLFLHKEKHLHNEELLRELAITL